MKNNKGFIDLMVIGLVALAAFTFSVISYKKVNQPLQSFGSSFNPTGGQTYRLQSSVSSTQTTITLTSFKEPVSGIKYTMSYLNSSIEYGTIDPSNNSTKEFISFTGITQNSDNTATLTGVTRGLGFSYPYTASSTLAQPHSGQSIFILSNPPQLTNQYANKSNDESITGIWSFNTLLPQTSILATTSSQFTNKAYVDGVALVSAPNADEVTKGVVELATQIESASSTATGSTGAAVVLQAKYATSSPSSVCGLCTPITQNNGKLSTSFIDQSASYIWSGTATTTANATSTAILTANTLVATSSLSTPSITLNGFGPATTTLMGVIEDSGQYSTSNTSSTTLASFTVPANSISNNGSLFISGYLNKLGGNNIGCVDINFGTGVASSSVLSTCVNGAGSGGLFSATIRNLNSFTNQFGAGQLLGQSPQGTNMAYGTTSLFGRDTSAKTFISVGGLVLNGGDTLQIKGVTITKLP